jgi:flavoprotein
MTFARSFIFAAALALLAGNAAAQFVKGNEAVTVMPDGTKKVDTAPSSAASSKTKPCAANAGCHPGPWHMVETSNGLQECTEPFARATTCRDSTYGSQKLSRLWIAKRGTKWLWCQYPDLGKKCVDMNARPPLNLPVSAVQ